MSTVLSGSFVMADADRLIAETRRLAAQPPKPYAQATRSTPPTMQLAPPRATPQGPSLDAFTRQLAALSESELSAFISTSQNPTDRQLAATLLQHFSPADRQSIAATGRVAAPHFVSAAQVASGFTPAVPLPAQQAQPEPRRMAPHEAHEQARREWYTDKDACMAQGARSEGGWIARRSAELLGSIRVFAPAAK